MRHLPTNNYCGLTIVLSQPSRQDLHALLTGTPGFIFNQECLSPRTDRWSCDIRTSDTIQEGLLPNTRGLLLLGDRAFKEWTTPGVYDSYTLNEQRGVPLVSNFSLPTIASYTPQDSCDFVDHESRLNPHLLRQEGHSEEDDEDGDEYSEKKRHGRTSRSNYRHWLRRDTKKILWAIDNAESLSNKKAWDIRVYPNEADLVRLLGEWSEGYLYLDIETDIEHNVLCIGLNHSSSDIVLCIPLLRHDYTLAYSSIARILRAIVLCCYRNTVVIHNSMFDLFVLADKYKIAPPRQIYDTLIAQHRMFPEVEKSLGHCLSAWSTIWEPFHKDEGVFMPWNTEQEKQLWSYNTKDVYGMRLVHEAQMAYVNSQESPAGLATSIAQGMRAIRPFLLMTFEGIRADDTLRQQIIADNDILMTNYLRALNMLTGPGVDLLPTSSKSCIKYFHDMLGYPIVGKSKDTGAPSLNETNMWKLKLKNPHNVAIDFCIKYRQHKKESGMLGFEPWKL